MLRLTPIACLLVLVSSVRGEEPHLLESAPAILREAAPVVEKVCGARYRKAPKIVEATPQAAALAFENDLTSELARLYPMASKLQVKTMVRAAASSSVRSCVARYSPSLKAVLVVRQGFDRQVSGLGYDREKAGALLRAAIAHEAVHALDDERFDLAAKYAACAGREELRASAMVIEGRAVHFGRKAAADLGVSGEVAGLLPDPKDYRGAFLHLTYRLGEAFIAALIERGGIGLADRALAEPPLSTRLVCRPALWPGGRPDRRPVDFLRRVFPDGEVREMSELELRARYLSLDGLDASTALIEPYRGGASVLVSGTNAAVLAFETEEAAALFEKRSRTEVPAHRSGTLVLRAAGAEAEAIVARMKDALEPGDGTETPR